MMVLWAAGSREQLRFLVWALQVWHPAKYASMLAEKMAAHGTTAWLVNTGWTGGRWGGPGGTCVELWSKARRGGVAGGSPGCGVPKTCQVLQWWCSVACKSVHSSDSGYRKQLKSYPKTNSLPQHSATLLHMLPSSA